MPAARDGAAETGGPGHWAASLSTLQSRPRDLQPFLSGQARTYTSMRRYRGADGRALRAMVTLGAIRDANGAGPDHLR